MAGKESVIALLREHGYVDAGTTGAQPARGRRSRRGFAERVRMHHATRDNDWVSVGTTTTSFYQRSEGRASGFENFRTAHEGQLIADRAANGRTRAPLTFKDAMHNVVPLTPPSSPAAPPAPIPPPPSEVWLGTMAHGVCLVRHGDTQVECRTLERSVPRALPCSLSELRRFHAALGALLDQGAGR